MSEARSKSSHKPPTSSQTLAKNQPTAASDMRSKTSHKPRKALASSAFIPAEWKVENTAPGLVGLITEVVQAIDRQYVTVVDHGKRDQRTRNMSRVSIVDDRNSIFTRDAGRRGPLPRGSHAVVSDHSVSTRCPGCKHKVVTVVQRHTGGKNIVATAAVAAIGFVVSAPATIVPLALTALSLNSLKRKVHYCPLCNYKMGKHVTITIPHK